MTASSREVLLPFVLAVTFFRPLDFFANSLVNRVQRLDGANIKVASSGHVGLVLDEVDRGRDSLVLRACGKEVPSLIFLALSEGRFH